MPAAPEATRRPTAPYDFRRPNQFNREHMRALQIASETFARQFNTVLSTALRTVSQVALRSVTQLSYDEYIRDVPNPTCLALVSLPPLNGTSLLHLPLPLAMSLVDRLLGGTGEGSQPLRPLTDIDAHVISGLLDRVLRELSYAFESLARIEATIVQQESNPQFAQVAAATDMIVAITLDVKVGSLEDVVTLCIPLASLKPVLDERITAVQQAGRRSDSTIVQAALATQLENVPMEVRVAFSAVSLPSADVVGLRPGDVLPLHHDVTRPLTVSIAGVPCFAAVPGRKGKRLACQIVDPQMNQERSR